MSDELRPDASAVDPAIGDVTVLLGQLQSGDRIQKEEARRRLDDRFAAMMKAAIRERLGPRVRQRVGASDVYQELMKSFFRRLDEGEYALPDRDALRALLFEMIKNKVINARLHHRCKKRDVERELPLAEDGAEGDGATGLEQVADGAQRPDDSVARPYRRNLPRTDPTDGRGDSWFANKELIELFTYGADQHDAVEVEEVYNSIKSNLDQKPPLGLIFDRLLAGFSDEDIAKEIGKTEARVRHLTGQIRKRMVTLGVAPEFQDQLNSGIEKND